MTTTTETSSRVLSVSDAIAIGTILDYTIRCAKVAYMMDEEVIWGTARSVGDESGNLTPEGTDVRDCYMRITTQMGWEMFVPMKKLIPAYHEGTFTAYDW